MKNMKTMMRNTTMLSSSFSRCSLLASVAMLAACSSAAAGDNGASDTSEGAQTSCTTGIMLPDAAVEGYVVSDPVAPKKSLGISLGVLDERAPTSIDPPAMLAYDDASGLARKGYEFHAKRGERFSMDSFTSQSVGFEVFGPIQTCHAPATDAPASFEGIHGWRAPADGTYLVVPAHSLYRETSGAIHPYPQPEASYPGVLAIRRLLADDTPAGHAFVESTPLPLYGASAVAVRTLAGETKPALLMIGTKLPATNGGAAQVPSLVVVRQHAEPLYVPQCKEGLGGITAGDFDGDGATDVLSGTNLFKGNADGTFTCEPSGLVVYGGTVMGPVDVDGDGAMDVLSVEFNGGGSSTTTTVWVTPYFRRGAAFVSGANRRLDVPFGTTFDGTRSAFLDVTGDGKPEIVASMIDPAVASNPAVAAEDKMKVLAFAVPTYVPQDATPQAIGAPSLALVRVTAITSLTPHPYEIDNRGPRLFDADGDGLRDQVLPRTTYSYAGFGLAYGAPAPAGGFRLPWDVPSMNNFGSQVIVEHLDYDGDGCEDVLVAGYGMRLFRGVRCIPH
ncbi:MAG: hypothetical protein JWO86_4163 [Myxococcaceae bacterium]|nr:hypothetical protein [Myxococcaceae bacterium]